MYTYYINFLRNKNEANIFAYLIRAAENTPYNHVEISCELLGAPTEFFSSVMPVSRMASKESIEAHYTIIKRRKLKLKPNVTDQEALDYLHSLLGRKYSLSQNIIIALKLSIHCLKNMFNSFKLNLDKYLNCTEYCTDFITEKCVINKTFVSTETVSLTELDCDEIGEDAPL